MIKRGGGDEHNTFRSWTDCLRKGDRHKAKRDVEENYEIKG
jgi:hypothetical protein